MRIVTICAFMSLVGCASDSEPVSKQHKATTSAAKPAPDKAKNTKTSVDVAKGGCPHATKHAGCPHADKHAGCPHAASAEKHHAHGGCPHAKKKDSACDCDKKAGSGCPHGKEPGSCPHHKAHGADHAGCQGCPSYKSDDWAATHAKKLQKLVKLSDDQTAKAKAFLTTFGPKMREVRTQLKKAHHGELKLADAQLKALRDKKAKLTKERNAGLQAILSAKQFETFKKLLDHHDGECPCGKKDN